MNLAETASIFFETALGDASLEKASTPAEKFEHGWCDAEVAWELMTRRQVGAAARGIQGRTEKHGGNRQGWVFSRHEGIESSSSHSQSL